MGKGTRNRLTRAETKKTIGYRDVRREVLREVNAELAKATDRFYYDEVTIILWVLHETFGFGKDRLRRFYHNYGKVNAKLKEHYQFKDNDLHYLTQELLKGIGVSIEEFEGEEE